MPRHWTNSEFAQTIENKRRNLQKLRYELIEGYGRKPKTYVPSTKKPFKKFENKHE